MQIEDNRLEDLTVTALTCRTYNHRWLPDRDDGAMIATAFQGKRIVQVEEVSTCETCTTKRHDIYPYPSYDAVVHKYVYPDGYRVRQLDGVPRLTRVDFRRALFAKRKPAVLRPAA